MLLKLFPINALFPCSHYYTDCDWVILFILCLLCHVYMLVSPLWLFLINRVGSVGQWRQCTFLGSVWNHTCLEMEEDELENPIDLTLIRLLMRTIAYTFEPSAVTKQWHWWKKSCSRWFGVTSGSATLPGVIVAIVHQYPLNSRASAVMWQFWTI